MTRNNTFWRGERGSPDAAGIYVTVDPDRFTARIFADNFTNRSFVVDRTVKPGDFCFSAILRTPTGRMDCNH